MWHDFRITSYTNFKLGRNSYVERKRERVRERERERARNKCDKYSEAAGSHRKRSQGQYILGALVVTLTCYGAL